MDEETARTVLEIQLRDTRALLTAELTSRKPGTLLSDTGHTLSLQVQELRRTIASLNDRNMAKSMSQAIQDDFPILAVEIATERQAERDRDSSLRMNNPQAPRR